MFVFLPEVIFFSIVTYRYTKLLYVFFYCSFCFLFNLILFTVFVLFLVVMIFSFSFRIRAKHYWVFFEHFYTVFYFHFS